MGDPLLVLVMLAVAAVVVVLAVGIGGFGRGGEKNAQFSNKMMRWRIILQAVAVVLILVYFFLRSSGGQ